MLSRNGPTSRKPATEDNSIADALFKMYKLNRYISGSAAILKKILLNKLMKIANLALIIADNDELVWNVKKLNTLTLMTIIKLESNCWLNTKILLVLNIMMNCLKLRL